MTSECCRGCRDFFHETLVRMHPRGAPEQTVVVTEKWSTSLVVTMNPKGDINLANALIFVYAITDAGESLLSYGLVAAGSTPQRVVEVWGKGAKRFRVTIVTSGEVGVETEISVVQFGSEPR